MRWGAIITVRGAAAAAALLAAIVLAGWWSAGDAARSATPPAPAPPDVVVVLADDMRADQLRDLPAVLELAAQGVRFTNASVSNPLCCPSRATILTGRYSHSTGVYTNDPTQPAGGWAAFRPNEDSTVATWLDAAGYRTALVGKYMNGYPDGAGAVTPPGWDHWFAFAGTPGYYRYGIADDGVLRHMGDEPADYSTDVLRDRATAFIESTRSHRPLFLLFAPYAPHLPSTPAPRHADTVPVTSSWRPANFNELDVADKPAWVREMALRDGARMDGGRARQSESLRALDDAVRAIVAALRASGRLANTMLVFTSDNGMQWGSHRWTAKEAPYQESVKVPLIVRYDPLTAPLAGTTDHRLVVNADFAPTIAAAAGVAAPGSEGRSLLRLLRNPDAPWRTQVLLEHVKGTRTPIPTYCGIRTARYKLVEYATGERELYDLDLDPRELTNRAGDGAYAGLEAELHRRLVHLCTPLPPGLRVAPCAGRLKRRPRGRPGPTRRP